MGNEVARALKAADPDRGGARPVDVDGLAAEYQATQVTTLDRFVGVDRTSSSFASLQDALERLTTPEGKDGFARDFTALSTLYEFLHPCEVTESSGADYKWLAQIYEASRPSKPSNALLWHRLGPKTIAMVHGHMSDVRVTGTGLEEVVVDPDAIEAMRKLIGQGKLDIPDDRDLLQDPVTLDEVLTVIDRRIRRRLIDHPTGIYRSIADQIEKLRRMAITRAEDSVEFLKKALELARAAVEAERLESEGRLDEAEALHDPNIGALTQIVEQYKPPDTPVVVTAVVTDIDSIVRQVSFTGWTETQEGDRTVRKELRLVLGKYHLPLTGHLFDAAYAYIRENY